MQKFLFLIPICLLISSCATPHNNAYLAARYNPINTTKGSPPYTTSTTEEEVPIVDTPLQSPPIPTTKQTSANRNEFSGRFLIYDKRYKNYYGTIEGQYTIYYRYYVPPGEIGVLTLRNGSNTSDFDLFVYSDKQMNKLLSSGKHRGSTTERNVISPQKQGRYVYIKILNDGTRSSKFKLFCHDINPKEKFAIALIEVALAEAIDPGNDNVVRAIGALSSVMQGNDLGGVSRDAIITEVRIAIRKELGHGPIADVMIGTIAGIITDIYKH